MSPIKETYDSQGFVIVPGLISSIPTLQEATDTIINRTRAGSWPYRRTVGKQFPPFDNDNPDSWGEYILSIRYPYNKAVLTYPPTHLCIGVQHVMHPELGEPAEVLSRWYTSDPLTRVCP